MTEQGNFREIHGFEFETGNLKCYSVGLIIDFSWLITKGPAAPEEFENEGFTLKTHQIFSVHATPEEFENGGFTLKNTSNVFR